MNQIKPIEYESIIVQVVNGVYLNLKDNCTREFHVPQPILDFFEATKKIKTREDIESFGAALDKTFGEWKPISEQPDKTILLNHLMSILQNAIIVIRSLDKNLENEALPTKVITEKLGLDLVVATAVQMVGQKSAELIKEFDQLELKNDPLIIFAKLNDFVHKVAEQEAEAAFAKLMDNLIEYTRTFQETYKKLSELGIDDFTNARIKQFMAYLDANYLFILMLRLVLIYPLQEGMIEKNIFDNIVPNIELY